MKLKNIFFKRNGTITLFAALSMTFLITFFLLIVDISRIFLFSKLTESSTKLASKSVLSAYDYRLYERYGLFGRGGTDGLEIAKDSMDKNLYSDFNVFNLVAPITLVPIELKSVEVMYDNYLGHHDELEQQIVEEMKYKAPIEFTLEVIESFKGIKQAAQTADVLMESLEKLEELYEQREEALQTALSFQEDITALEKRKMLDTGFSGLQSGYSSYISNLNTEKTLGEQIAELREKIAEGETDEDTDNLLEKLDKKQLDLLERERSSIQSSISQYASASNQLLASSEANQSYIKQRLPSLVYELEGAVNLAQTLNTTLSIQVEMLKMKQDMMAKDNQDEMSKALNMSFETGELIRPRSFFVTYVEEVKQQSSMYSSYVEQGGTFTQTARAAIQQPHLQSSSHSGMNNSLTTFNKTYAALKESYISPATVLVNRMALLSEVDDIKKQQIEDEKLYEKLQKDSHYLLQLAAITVQLEQDRATFDGVNTRYKRNYERNIELEVEQLTDEFKMDKKGSINANKGLDFVNGLLNSVDQAGQMLQAHLYRNEYILQRFNHLPIGKLENIVGDSIEEIGFRNQEVEYIMIGLAAPSANISIIVSEIFLLRLAIRTIEGLIANKHLAHPLLILSASLVHGLKYALADMDELFRKGYTELSKYAKVNISYPLYLRFLLNIHGLFRKANLSRIAAVIEHELDLDLMQVPTSTIVLTSSKTKLWILPSISSILVKQSSLPLNVENGYYEKFDYASSSY